jgi:hypothetical protein
MNSNHRCKRIVEFADGSFGVEECHVGGEWHTATSQRFNTEYAAQQWCNENTVKRIVRGA